MRTVLKLSIVALIFAGHAWAQNRAEVTPRMPGDRGPGSTEAETAARNAEIDALEPCDILGVFAHPDDETFSSGTFALLAAKGQRVQLVYATSGDAGGDKSDRGLKGDALGKEREQEMRNAAKALALSTEPLFLRYPDGQVYDHWYEVIASVQAVIEKTQPKVVVTFGPDGLYGHADHVAIGQIAGRAFDETGIATHLLHVALSRSKHAIMMQAINDSRYKAVAEPFITYSVDVAEELEQRVGAMGSHVTQFYPQEVAQFRMLAAGTRMEDFVEVRHSGETGALAELFTK